MVWCPVARLTPLVAVLRFTMPTQQADSLTGCDPAGRASAVAAVRVYRTACGVGQPRLFVRQKPEGAGNTDTVRVDDSTCATYFLAAVDSAGREGCGRGITVGVPATGVGGGLEAPADTGWFDVQGRRVPAPRRGWWSKRRLTVPRRP